MLCELMAERKDLTRAAEALNAGAIHVLRGLEAVDRRSGLTPARLSALSVLVFAGPRSLGALARAEGVAGPTMTRIVDGLVDLGLARRSASDLDGRVTLVEPTSQGRTVMLAARRRRVRAIAHAIGQLSSSEQRRLLRAAPLLDQVAAALVRDVSAPGSR
jgi:DNA-binding MarR family transcriptional regulator